MHATVDPQLARGLPPRIYVPVLAIVVLALVGVTVYFLRISFGVAGSALGAGTPAAQASVAPLTARAPDEIAMPQSGVGRGAALPGQSVGGGGASQGGPPPEVVRMLTDLRGRLRHNPNDLVALVGLAGLYAEANEPAKAAPLYGRAVALDPTNPQTRTDYAAALHLAGDDPGALRELARVVSAHSDYSPALYEQGVVAANTGNRALAIGAYRRFLAVAPNDPQADDARTALRALGAS
jgi:Flp pilus assembly protein TadD